MSAKYRYPGLGYFEATDNDIFFGRDKEIADLQAMVGQEKATVLYSRPGLGKISLLLAGVLPAIRQNLSKDDQKKAIVHTYIIRFQTYRPGNTVKLIDTVNAAICKSENSGGLRTLDFYLPENDSHIWAHFKNHELAAKPDEKLLFVLIIDHLEEIFTYPESEIQWFKQFLSELLDEYAPKKIREFLEKEELEEDSVFDRNTFRVLQRQLPVKIVFSLPSDKYYLVNRFRDVLPNIIKNVYELEPMSEQQAREAIDKPALLPQEVSDQSGETFKYKSPSFSFSEAAREEMIRFLSNRSGNDFEQGSKFIDAYGLQIICSYCERKIIMEDNQKAISINNVLSLDEMIKEYYLKTISELGLDPEDQKMVHELFEQKMIYEEDRSRLVMYEKIILNECQIKKDVLEKLKRTRLIKEEAYSLGGISFEISSKILVNPMLLAKSSRNLMPLEGPTEYAVTEELKQLSIKIDKNPGDYTNYKQRGDYFYFDKRYEDAIADYKKAIELNAGDKELYNFIGVIYYTQGIYPEAIDYYSQAIKIDDKYHIAYSNMGLVYLASGNYDEAEKYFKMAITAKPDYADVYNRLGYLYETKVVPDGKNHDLQLEYYEKAKEYYNQAIVKDELYVDPIINLGNIYYKTGDYATAQKYYEKVLTIQPTNVSAINNVGLLCWAKGDKNAAEDKFSEALKIDPAFSLSLSNLFRLLIQEEKFDEALEQLDRFSLVSPDIIEDCNSLGRHYYEIKDYERTIVVCKRLLESDPSNTGLLNILGLCYYYLGQFKEALKVFEHIKEIDPKAVNSYINAALVYAQYNEWDKAFENCNIARSMDPENITVARNLGVWYRQKKEFIKAISEFENYEKYCLARSTEAEINAQAEIGECYLELGEYDKAIEYLKRGIEFNPDAGYIYKSLAITCLKKSDFENAFRNYCLAIQHFTTADVRVEDYKELIGAYESVEKTGKTSADDLSSAELDTLGLSYEYGGQYEKAELMYKLSISKTPDFYSPHINLGYLNETQKKFKEAINCYEAANRLDAENFDPVYRIANCYYDLKMMDKSADYFRKSDLIRKDDPNVLLCLGNIEVYKGNYNNAGSFYLKSLDNNGDQKVNYNNLGATAQNLGFLDRAIMYNTKSIALDSQYGLPLVNLGSTFCDKREYAKSFEYLFKALKLQEDIYVHMYFANLYRKLYIFPKALESLNRCREIDAFDEDYLYYLGRYYFDLQQWDLVNEQVQKALEINPTHKSAMFLAGKVCQRNGQFDQALSWFERALALDAGDYFPKFHMAKLNYHFKRPEGTKKLLDELSSVSFESYNLLTPLVYELLGDWLNEAGKTDDAVSYYAKALKDDPRKESLIQKIIDLERNRNGLTQAKHYEDYLKDVVGRRKVETRTWIK